MRTQPMLTRRMLLTAVPLVTPVIASAVQADGQTPDQDPAAQDPRQPEFNMTEHVATYYRLARR